ncbi:hypothetical protein TrST_g4346 [Triparma strigata]|uniref:IC97/Casc1 N-terminal domain-containing protein n=1 Tax=Triparma strigata TaxID=1606541 RepID=A0A9W7ELU8_9STRA|nr:hypothetical protein TrST_g4346 [Triparma strigata]
MGPKKKGKKSKAEIEAEKLAAEQEAIKAAEAAEKKRIADELAAEEAAKKKKEDHIEYRTMELDRLKKSYEDMLPIIEARVAKLEMNKKQIADSEEWAAFTACSYRPRITESELNTYITETNDRPEMSLTESLECLNYTESIIEDLNSRVIKMKSEEVVDEGKIAALQAFVPKMREMCIAKLDKATVNILQNADKHLKGGGEGKAKKVEMCERSGNIKVGMWVNLIRKDKFRFLDLDFKEKLGMLITLPKQFASLEVAVRGVHFPYNQISARFGTKDLVLGGVFQFDIIHLPPMSKKVKGWVMRKMTEEGSRVCKSNWPIGNADGVISKAAAKIKCCITLPEGLVVDEDLSVKWFHPVDGRWTTEPIEETEYNMETRELRFTTVSTGSIAVVQDRLTDLCYKSWSLSPFMIPGGGGCVNYSIITPRFVVTIEASSDGLCRLTSPDHPALAELRAKRLSPGDILYALKSAGINLLPVDSDAPKAKYVDAEVNGITLKAPEIESKLYEEVSYLSTSFDFLSSRWNNGLGAGKSCVQVKETDAFTGGTDLVDYSMCVIEFDEQSSSSEDAPGVGVCVGGVKCSLVNSTEGPSYRNFGADLVDNTEGEVFLGKCLENIATKEAMGRVNGGDMNLLASTVRCLLQLSRPFSFC